MPELTRTRLTYANVVATAALALGAVSLAIFAVDMVGSGPSLNSGATTWFLAGTGTELPSCTSCEVSLPASGSGSFGSTQNTGNDQLSPNVPIVASDLTVHVDTAPGGNARRTFVLFFRSDPSHSLRCDIIGSNTTCNSGAQAVTIPPGSRLLVDAANSGNALPTKIQFSWRGTPP
jgi:hypothetical protein